MLVHGVHGGPVGIILILVLLGVRIFMRGGMMRGGGWGGGYRGGGRRRRGDRDDPPSGPHEPLDM